VQIWPHQQQAKQKSGSEFGVDVCVFTFALAMIGKVFKPRSNVLFNLDGFGMVFLDSLVVDHP